MTHGPKSWGPTEAENPAHVRRLMEAARAVDAAISALDLEGHPFDDVQTLYRRREELRAAIAFASSRGAA